MLLKQHDVTHLELCPLNQLEDQAISINQLVLDGEPSPSSAEAFLHREVERVGLVVVLIHQGDRLVTLGQVLPAEIIWEALRFRKPIKQEFTSWGLNNNRKQQDVPS